MRPDFVTESNCPTLFKLSKQGATFTKHHAAYPSATEVNGTVLATGVNPARDLIVGNHEYRPYVDELSDVHTEALASVRKGDENNHGEYIGVPTLAETVRAAGRTAVVAGSKPVALLLDRKERTSTKEGVNLYAGATLPASLGATVSNQFGPYPDEDATNPSRIDWTVDALITDLWSNGVPAFSFVWMNQPDLAQHRFSPGSKEALASIRNSDDNLAKILAALDKKGVRDSTDVIVVSDHGCSTIAETADLPGDLAKAGFHAARKYKTKPNPGDIIVASNSGSTMVYVIGHDKKIVNDVVNFLRKWKHTGVIFSREAPGAFPLKSIHANSPEAPDILISLRWSQGTNKFGVPGIITTDGTTFKPGQGAHVTLCPYDMHNTLIAAGPDFRAGYKDQFPSGNLDVAPTVLRVLGVNPKQKLDGRILTEALKDSQPQKLGEPKTRTRRLIVQNWEQYLTYTQYGGVEYYDEGNGAQK